MSDLLTRDEAVAILGIKPQTLYCYVSRGFIRRVPQSDGRSSFYLREDVENVRAKSAARSGHGPAAASAMRWGEPVIGTGITEITEQGPRYRNRLATELARSRFGFENIAEFLWGGDLAEEPVRWRRVDPPDGFTRALAEASALHPRPHLLQLLTMACTALGIAEGSRRERIQSGATPVQAARRLIRTLTGTFGFPGPLRAFVDLEDGEPIAEGTGLRGGRDDVIDGRERPVRIGDRHPVLAQHVERLRARHFVHEVQSDEQLRLSARQRADGMGVPDFAEKGLSHDSSLEYTDGRISRFGFRFWRADVHFTRVPGIIGVGGVSKDLGETNLSGVSARFKVLAGR